MNTARKKDLLCLIGQLGNGGSEKQLYLFLKHLDRSLYSPRVLVNNPSNAVWRTRIESELDVPVNSGGELPAVAKMLAFRMRMLRKAPDIIFSWSFYTNAFAIVAGNARFIGSLRVQIEEERDGLRPIHFQQCLKAPLLVVNSGQLVDDLVNEGVPKENTRLVHNIFETKFASVTRDEMTLRKHEIRKKYGIPSEAIVVMGAGRNSPGKDFPFWVDVFSQALKVNPNLHAFLLGNGGTAVAELVRERGLNKKFTIPGEVPGAHEIFAAADIFFLSSKIEGMPNVLLEAVDAGTAPLATDVGGVRDILTASASDFIVRHGNVNTATDKLLALAKDANLRAAVAKDSRLSLKSFSAERIMPQYYDILN